MANKFECESDCDNPLDLPEVDSPDLAEGEGEGGDDGEGDEDDEGDEEEEPVEVRCPYCDSDEECRHFFCLTGPTTHLEEGGFATSYLSCWVDDRDLAPLVDLGRELLELGGDLGSYTGPESQSELHDRVFALDHETMSQVVNEDAFPFWDYGNWGQADIAEWLEDCSIGSTYIEYETEGMGTDLVRAYYSEDPKASALFLCGQAKEFLDPLRAVRKTVQTWLKA